MANNELRKVYVKSGELQVIGMATNPLEAAVRALSEHGDNHTVDPDNFYVDERGFREDDAEWVFPVEFVIEKAGYEFEEDDDGPSGGIGALVGAN